MLRVYGINVRSRPAAIALAAVALSVGAVFVAFGIVLLLGVAAVGTAIGTGVLLYRALTGRSVDRLRRSEPPSGLDPSLEVFPSKTPRDKLTS